MRFLVISSKLHGKDVHTQVMRGGSNHVDLLEMSSTSPTLEILLLYDAVLVDTLASNFGTKTDFPIHLKKYSDMGHGVVLMAPAANEAYSIGPPFLQLSPLPCSRSWSGGSCELWEFDAHHRIFQNVKKFAGGVFTGRAACTQVTQGSRLLARWEDGCVFAAERWNGIGCSMVVLLNFTAASNEKFPWGSNGWDPKISDGHLLMHNALVHVAQCWFTEWLGKNTWASCQANKLCDVEFVFGACL